jgi:hypothetical protein
MRWRVSWPKLRPTFKIQNLVAGFPFGFPIFVPVLFFGQIDSCIHKIFPLGALRIVLGHLGGRLAEHGVDAIAVATFEVIGHPVLGLEVANDRLGHGAAPHLTADGAVTWRAWPLIQTAELLGVVVAAIAFVDVDAAGLDPGRGKPGSRSLPFEPASNVRRLPRGSYLLSGGVPGGRVTAYYF